MKTIVILLSIIVLILAWPLIAGALLALAVIALWLYQSGCLQFVGIVLAATIVVSLTIGFGVKGFLALGEKQ